MKILDKSVDEISVVDKISGHESEEIDKISGVDDFDVYRFENM